MSGKGKNKLTFTVKWEDSNRDRIDFEVVSFEGHEAISKDYEFKLNLRSEDSLNNSNILGLRGTLSVELENTDDGNSQIAKYHGIIFEFSASEKMGRYYYYELTLAPKFAKLKHSKKSDVFINSNLAEILNTVLNEELAQEDRELAFDVDDKKYHAGKDIYNRYNYVCQYEESDYNFINRILQRDGLYYYFEQGDEQEKLIITDNKDKFLVRSGDALYFRSLSDQTVNLDPNALTAIKCKQKTVASQVTIKNFGYEKAHLGDKGVISCSSSVGGPENEGGGQFIGEEIIYGENFVNPDNDGDGMFLAKIRAEEIYWQSKVYHAKSSIVPIFAGMKVELSGEQSSNFNREYLVIEAIHVGCQQLPGMEKSLDRPFYENTLALIPANVQFRPQRKVPWPKIYGTMNALIDAEGNTNRPQLDRNGRYKIRLPFLKYEKEDGKGSIWLRLATPYAGDAFGFHFPLHKNTEVVLSFRDGNPDLPIIMGAVFNSLHQNVVINQNAYLGGVLITGGGNILAMDDTKGANSIGLATNNNWQYFQ